MISCEKLFKDVEILDVINPKKNQYFQGISFNSKTIKANYVFFCFKGENANGRDYIKDAIANGAIAIVCEEKIDSDITQFIVKNVRSCFALASKNLYGCVCDKLKIVGVCGTNGKTTTTHIISHILNYVGKNTGIIGTNGAIWNGNRLDFNMTTPDSDTLHKILYDMYIDGVEYVAMEVSAHAIYYNKLDGINFEIGVMTNITQDHLDFFKTFENYKQTKLGFANSSNVKCLVYNCDDENIREGLINTLTPKISFGIDNPSDCFVAGVKMDIKGSSFLLNYMDNLTDISTKLCGNYNIQNIMASFCVSSCLGVKAEDIREAIAQFCGVDGRFNVYSSDKGYNVIIDYAHTPDGLKKILLTLGGMTSNKLICVFGCGGNRDKEKRPIMGAIADKLCDFIVLTSDNPRFEDPSEIIEDISKGISGNNYTKIINRQQAIQYALNLAKPNDIVAILGKGSENYIDQLGSKTYFSDKEVVLANI